MRFGLVIHFDAALIRDGIPRVVNGLRKGKKQRHYEILKHPHDPTHHGKPCLKIAIDSWASRKTASCCRFAHGCRGQLAARARRCYAPILRWQSWDCNRQALDYRQCQILVPALGSIESAISDLHGLEPPRRRLGQQAARGTRAPLHGAPGRLHSQRRAAC
jgi:hypothetical protein